MGPPLDLRSVVLRAVAGARRVGRALVAALIAGCSGLSGTASPAASATASAGAAASPSDSPSDSQQIGPAPTNWPTTVIDGSIAIAAADASFKKMNSDVTTAVNSTDPRTILTVMTDALKFLKSIRGAATYLQDYGPTKDTGDKLGAAFDEMISGAQAIVDGVNAGDGPGVQHGFDQFFAGDAAYAAQTGPLSDLAQQALLMKRNLTK